MTSMTQKSAKGVLTVIATVVTILLGLQPYLNVVAENKAQDSKINLLEQQQRLDHDLIIKMSSDITYIKDTVKELKDRNK